MFIHQISSFYSHRDGSMDVKQACKKVAANYIRRTDRFIQLGILGASNLTPLKSNTALYLVSGQGDLAVFNRICEQRYIDKTPPKPVDFINSLSNTAGFYISQFLGLDSSNLNLSHQGFVVENALRLAKAKLELKKEEQILLGGIDEKPSEVNDPHHYLDLDPDVAIGEGSNWLLLNQNKNNALAQVLQVSPPFDSTELLQYLDALDLNQTRYYFAINPRASLTLQQTILDQYQLTPFQPECDFYETNSLYFINQFISSKSGHLLFINALKDRYCLTLIKVL